MYQKRQTYRSEAWRRAVASLPCAWCMRDGPSQAAHRNQGKSLTREQRRELADQWVIETVRRLAEDGAIKV